MYEHRCQENINNLYKTAGRYYDQQQYKAILEATMVSTPEECNDKSTMKPNQYKSKNPSLRKPPHQFLETLDVRHNTDVRRLGSSKAKRKAIRK